MKPRWGLEGCSTSQGMAGAPEAGRGRRDPACEPLEGVGFGVHLDFWFSPSKLGGNKFLLFLVVLFVAAGYAAVPQGYTQCSAPHGNVSSPCLSPFWTPHGAHVFDVILWLHSDSVTGKGSSPLLRLLNCARQGRPLLSRGSVLALGVVSIYLVLRIFHGWKKCIVIRRLQCWRRNAKVFFFDIQNMILQ